MADTLRSVITPLITSVSAVSQSFSFNLNMLTCHLNLSDYYKHIDETYKTLAGVCCRPT
jgi:hypothetical protein